MYYDVGMASSERDDEDMQVPLGRCDVLSHDRGDAVVVELRGEFDLDDVPKVTAALSKALDNSKDQVELDLGSLTFIDSAGLKALVDMYEAAAAANVTFSITSISPEVRRVIEVAGLDYLMTPT